MNKHSHRLPLLLSLLLLPFISGITNAKDVTIGYQNIINPFLHLVVTKTVEKETGYTVKWRRFSSGAKAVAAISSGSIDIAVIGSSPIASAVNRGVDIELIWILDDIADAEALIVHNKSDIQRPSDLKGKRIGIPFGSTTHFHMLFAMEQFGLSEQDVRLMNMQPNVITAAWARREIDAAFVWNPALIGLKKNGQVLLTSAALSRWGKPTFDGLVAHRNFSQKHGEFLAKFLKIVADNDEVYRTNGGRLDNSHPMVQSIARLTGVPREQIPNLLALYDFPNLDSQLSCQWLGCGQNSGAAKALKDTSVFLLNQNKVDALQQDYSRFVNPDFAREADKL